ncbi:MAG: hypothetical protein LBH59_05080, partial [Planctomycetaceae bacterium]|nr:hypothetical protein [Planctomycetaceae bacterium]
MRTITFLFLIFMAGVVSAYDNGVVPINTLESARRMINDLIETHGEKYPKGNEFLKQLNELEKTPNTQKLESLIREAALANPILDFDKILCVRRKPQKNSIGFTLLNAYTEDTIPRKGWDNEIIILNNLRGKPNITPIYKHPNNAIIRDLDLHFDAKKFLFASINEYGNWAVFEIGIDGNGLRELTPNNQKDIQWFDPCYLAEDGVILSFSTAGMQGVPCVAGSQKVASLYRIDTNKNNVRQLTFEQDSGWHPRLLNDGRVMYLRWQYTETPHYFDRMLFTMSPDGRQQKALWGSGAFFPAAYKHARPVLTHPSMILGVVSGHHALPEMGRLMLVDPNLGTHYPFRHDPKTKEWGKPGTHSNIYPRIYPKETTGCVQEIPGWGRDVIGNVYDNQGGDCKYTFAFPFPLDEKYFLTSMWVDHKGAWGIWLVDKFDNMVKICDLPEDGLFEPIPLMPRAKPRVISDLTLPESKEGTMFITDVYHGRGLPNIPRGKAKSLRIFSYHFAYWGTGNYTAIGEYSGYDIKRILGTVPIEEDGSACFKVPANTPIAMQVLDEDGAAIQIMQSWTIAMPGENVSCVGCHEQTNEATPTKSTIASRKPPREITEWFGKPRPFAFQTEVQPVLDQYCVGCHNDANKKETGILSFIPNGAGNWQRDQAYQSLHPFVRRPGTENDIATKKPMDFHASTSELIQRLRRGHYGVNLDREAWERLYTWIDLNAPYRGSWNSPKNETRRLELQKLYAGIDDNPEDEFRNINKTKKQFTPPQIVTPQEIKKLLKHNDDGSRRFHASIGPLPKITPDNIKAKNFPLKYNDAKKQQNEAATVNLRRYFMRIFGSSAVAQPSSPYSMHSYQYVREKTTKLKIEIVDDQNIRCIAPSSGNPHDPIYDRTTKDIEPIDELLIDQHNHLNYYFRRIPAGEFVIGSIDGFSDERPRAVVKI